MSNNLGLNQVLENQANKEVTINTATGQLDAALTEQLSVDVTAGNVSLSNTDYRRNVAFKITGAATAGRTVTVPAIKKLSYFEADPANAEPVDVVRGTGVHTIYPGSGAMVYTDGTTNGLTVVSESGQAATRVYDIGTFCAGAPSADEKLLRFNYPRAVDLPANLVDSIVTAQVAATAQTDFVVTLNGSGIGTIRFAAAGTTATFIGFAAQSISPGDVLMITAPSTPDVTLADIAFTIAGTRV